MSADDKFAALGDAHRRGITATLVVFDQALCEIEQWVAGREAHSALYEETNRLTAAQRERIAEQIASAREVLARIKADLGLHSEQRIASSAIRSLCSGLWEHLVELQSKHLRRYGKLPAGFCEYLDPQAEQLVEVLKNISDALRR